MSLRYGALLLGLYACAGQPIKQGKGSKQSAGASTGGTLKAGHEDPRDPHANGFEPRPGPEEGGSIWTFGTAHAAMSHVMGQTEAGDARAAVEALHAFAQEHTLHGKLGLPGPLGRGILQEVVRDSLAEQKRLNVLVLDAGLGGSSLELLLPLLSSEEAGHELISLGDDSSRGAQSLELIRHALGADAPVRHTQLLAELPDLLEDPDLEPFDVVLLSGDRSEQLQQLDKLTEAKALRPGARLHAQGAADPGFVEALQADARFEHTFHEVEEGTVSVSRLRAEL